MARAIRKQMYLLPEHDQKLKRLAREWGCTEAAVLRAALDRLPDPSGTLDERVVARLASAGVLVSWPDEGGPADYDARVDDIEREIERWAAAKPAPLGLAEAVDEDRGSR